VRYLVRFLAICAAASVAFAGFAFALGPQLEDLVTANRSKPDPINLDALPQRSIVYDSQGNVIGSLHAVENRAPVTLSQVPPQVRESVLAVEDENFYSHKGVNLRATVRALFADVTAGGAEQGGSTITMQLVKNLRLEQVSADRDLEQKTQEAVIARRLEDTMSKDEILERYLNTVYFGNGAYGVQTAAETYFGKNVEDLDWAEGALLAALIRDPRDYDPFVNPSLAIERRHIALQRLVEVGDLTQAEADVASFEPLPTQPSQLIAPPKDYFVEEVKNQLLDDPQFNLGADKNDRTNAVFEGGLRIYTTLDQSLQYKAIAARNDTLPDDGDPNGLFVINGGKPDIATTCPALNNGTNCLGTVSMVTIEPSSGAVRALVGGPGFDNWRYDLATQATRQPGSSMKMFVLVTALENGINVLDTIDGSSCSIKNPGGTPDPYTQPGEGGTATLIHQTAGSVNCAFLRLGQIVGIDKVIAQAQKMGVTAPLANVVSFPLGVNSVSPLEMTGAYASVANDGVFNQPYFIDKITDANGKVLYQHKSSGTRVMSQETARETTTALQAVVTGGTGTKAQLGARPVAGKTGTTDQHGDAWFIGYTPQLATGVWMGSPESVVPMNDVGGINVFGGTFPALVWHNYMDQALADLPVLQFIAPVYTRHGQYLRMPDDNNGYSTSRYSGSTRRSGPTTSTPTTPPTTTAPPPPPPTTTRPKKKPGGGGGGGGPGNGN
jgi:penicillin-binding protein 1A